MKLEEFLKKSLNCQSVKPTNHFGGGCISQGQSFVVDHDKKIFVKQNPDKSVSRRGLTRYFKMDKNCILSGKTNV